MKKFFKDYWDLCKMSGRFYKNHWFGTLLITVMGFALIFIPPEIRSYSNKKFYQKTVDEMKNNNSED